MNHRPLILIFTGMLCLYAALIPLTGRAAADPAGQDFSANSPWLIADPQLELLLPALRTASQWQEISLYTRVKNGAVEISAPTPAGAGLQRYRPSPNGHRSG